MLEGFGMISKKINTSFCSEHGCKYHQISKGHDLVSPAEGGPQNSKKLERERWREREREGERVRVGEWVGE